MATRESMGTNLPNSLIDSVVAGKGKAWAVSTITGSTFFGPYQPMQPNAQAPDKGAVGRQLDYPVGYNLRITPRQEEPITFPMLRALADGYDILRLVIETRKDQIEAFDWEIVPKDEKAKPNQYTADIKKATEFLERPSLEYDWSTWLRMSLEDVFVLDAWAIYPRATKGGGLASLDLIDGATLKRVIDEGGRTPLPPDPAYQQILKGIPAVDYTSNDILYMMRNPRTNRLYGYSPVEQIIMTVNIAIRRQISQLQYYTEGNIPEAIVGVDPSWTMAQVQAFQAWFDATLSGDTAARRKMTFIPGDASKLQFTKDPKLKDEYDEWLARVVCYCFSLPPTPFIKQMNRATAESSKDSSQEEGLAPLLTFIKRRMNYIIHTQLKLPNVQFRWKTAVNLDPETQATVDDLKIKNGTLSIDEVRERDGEQPLGVGNLIFTAQGPVPVSNFTKEGLAQAKADAAAQSKQNQDHQLALTEAKGNQPQPDAGGFNEPLPILKKPTGKGVPA